MQEILFSKIAVHFDIDEILKVQELLFADDIGVSAAKGMSPSLTGSRIFLITS